MSRLEMFWDFLSETLSVRLGSINIFSITDRDEKTVDIYFYVLTDTGYLHSEKLHGVLAAHKKKVHILSCLIDRDQCSYIKWYTWELVGKDNSFLSALLYYANFLSVYCLALSCLFVSPIHFLSMSPFLLLHIFSSMFWFCVILFPLACLTTCLAALATTVYMNIGKHLCRLVLCAFHSYFASLVKSFYHSTFDYCVNIKHWKFTSCIFIDSYCNSHICLPSSLTLCSFSHCCVWMWAKCR